MKYNWLLAVLIVLLTALVCLADGYQFPAGVPVKASDVTFYRATDHYQLMNERGPGGVHDRRHNVAVQVPYEPFGNPNMEFPWLSGGMDPDKCPNGKSFKFFSLPAGEKIVVYRDRGWRRDQTIGGTNYMLELGAGQIKWKYPDGTIFGEILQADGRTFEVRTMKKSQGVWDFRTYRPWTERDGSIVVSSSQQRMVNKHPVKVLNETATMDVVETDASRTLAMLRQQFRDVTDGGWCPTATKAGQIVPVGYQGGFFKKDTCQKCHDTVGKFVREFEPARNWYGNSRGSDSVFSLSIFDDSCASRDGNVRPVRFRSDLPLVRGE